MSFPRTVIRLTAPTFFCVGYPSPQSQAPQHLGGYGPRDQLSFAQLLGFAFRIVYYLIFLTVTGWVLLRLVYPPEPDEARRINDLWRLNLLRIMLLSLIAMIGFQLPNYIEDWDPSQLGHLIFATTVGISWLISLVLTFAAFAYLGRRRWFSWVWLAGTLISESINGHAIATGNSVFNTVILDIVHLMAASFWVGGLFYLLIHWKKNREHARSFLPVFSNMAFYSILFLVATGVLWTLVMVPHLKYLLYTAWGNLLIAKSALVILVIAAGYAIRIFMKRNKGNAVHTAVKADFGIMLAIVGIVGVFTYLNPLPQNAPLHWHVMAEKIHMTARITPNSPGTNKFTVRVWLPEQRDMPKYVQMYLNYKDDPEVAPIEVPLEASKGLEPELFPGFKQFSYEKEGPYLPFAGRWELEVRVMDSNDEETVYRKEESVY